MKLQQCSWLALVLAFGLTPPALARSISVEDGANQPESAYSSINGSVRVGVDARVGDLETVNGSIRVGTGSRAGRIESVNGGIELADGTEVVEIQAVNGGIELERDVLVKGDIHSVNGPVRTREGTRVSGSVATVNGEIQLDGTVVDGSLETYHGQIRLTNTEVLGDLHVRKPRGGSSWFGREKPTSVIIGPGSVIHGDLYFEKKVNLEVDDSAKVGEIHGDGKVYR